MTLKVEERCSNNRIDMIRIFHDVTEIKEIMNHTGSFNGINDEIHEYYTYSYEVWSGKDKLGIFTKNEHTKIGIMFNETEQLQ